MTYLALQPHVSFAWIDGRAVFLDLRRDRYFSLGQAAAAAFDELRRTPRRRVSSDAAATLLATGLFACGTGPFPCEPATSARPRFALPDDPTRFSLAEAVEIFHLTLRSRHQIYSLPLTTVIQRRRHGDPPDPANPADRTLALASRFRRARALVPVTPSCLQDSLALWDWLSRRGAFAVLVIGVKLDPFAAHCWVQRDATVLNDAPDRVAAFTPILTTA